MIRRYLKKQKRSDLFYAVKGYRKLINKKKLISMRSMHNKIHNSMIKSISFKPFFVKLSKNLDLEVVLRQYLLQHLVRKVHFSFLMQTGGKKYVNYTAPKEWLDKISEYNVLRLRVISIFNVIMFSFSRILKSMYLFYIIILNNLKKTKPYTKDHLNTAHFFDLVEGCIPISKSENQVNIINWYINWNKKLPNLNSISSNLKFKNYYNIKNLQYSDNGDPIRFVGSNYELFKFIIFYLIDLISSFGFLIIGNSANAIMLPELIMYRCVQFLGWKNNCGHYLFHYTWTIYRPLWTYLAEDRGSRITIYFTSLTATLESPFGENNNSFDYLPSSWPEYVVWSSDHKKEIKKYCLFNPKIFVKSNVPFKSFEEKNINLHKKNILIFDIEPQKLSRYIQSTGFSAHAEYIYYNKFMFKKFFNNILRVASENGFHVFLKRKRNLYDEENYSYKKLIKSLEKRNNFESLDPNLNIINLIKHANVVIGSPFTSVPFIAKQMGIKSIYYDPTDYVFKNDINSNNVKLITNFNELSEWFEKTQKPK